MNKYILLILVSFISSCVNENNAVDEPIIISNVDWSNSNTCNSSQDNIFINKLINKMNLEQKVGQIIMPDIDEVSSGDVKEYYTFLDNLQLTIKEDELTITNSLQKYYHGHNYGDFTFEEVGAAIYKLKNEYDDDDIDARLWCFCLLFKRVSRIGSNSCECSSSKFVRLG